MDAPTLIKLVAEIVGTAAVIGGWTFAVVATYITARQTKQDVHLIMTNHLAHIASEISTINTNVSAVDTRLTEHVKRFEDTKKHVDSMTETLIKNSLKGA